MVVYKEKDRVRTGTKERNKEKKKNAHLLQVLSTGGNFLVHSPHSLSQAHRFLDVCIELVEHLAVIVFFGVIKEIQHAVLLIDGGIDFAILNLTGSVRTMLRK